jgi:DNA-binding MarR family transcriptional regulator
MDTLLLPGFRLSEAGRLYSRHFEARSRDLSLDFEQCRTLLVLAENEGVSQRRLAELTAIGPAWLGRILDRLEALALVERRHRGGDRRVRTPVITENARALLPLLRAILCELRGEALRGLSAEETAILMNALEGVIANLSVLVPPPFSSAKADAPV